MQGTKSSIRNVFHFLITATPVTMAVKSHLRNDRPVLLNIATNDALAGASKNIFSLINYKNYYFVPMTQDDYVKKPCSLMGDFGSIPVALRYAYEKKQLQPVIGVDNHSS